MTLAEGMRVELLVGSRRGRVGTVAGVFGKRGCGCRTVMVRLDMGGEWAGSPSEVRPI